MPQDQTNSQDTNQNQQNQNQNQSQDQSKQGQQQNNQAAVETPDQLLDKANSAYEAYEKEEDATKKAELKEAAKASVAKAKEAYAAEKKASKEAADAAAAKGKAPETYTLKAPENSPLSQAHLDEISTFAKEKKLSNEAAQMLVERESKAVASFKETQQTDFETKKTQWLEDSKNDKQFGGDKFKESAELAHRVIERYASPSLKEHLKETGLGNHPELVRFVVDLGKEMSEDKLIIPGGQTQQPAKKSAAERLYGETTPTK